MSLKKPNKLASLTPDQTYIICDKGTEPPHAGLYNTEESCKEGSFICRACGLALYRGDTKFTSSCGWPSFDDQLSDHVFQLPDADGQRMEILCSRCHGHLGHIFKGEGFTSTNTRHCVNSISIEFVEDRFVLDTKEIILAAGCFWGVEYQMKKETGVLIAESGYIGGSTLNPCYEDVCNKQTGHLEAVRVVFDKEQSSYKKILEAFFEIHDFTQEDGQGPDIGPQYLSGIFTDDDEASKATKDCIQTLEKKGFSVATKLYPLSPFWKAEDYHQDYYAKQNKTPYCHIRRSIF